MHSVIANKSTDNIRTMLPSTARNITCNTDIKGAITLAGEDVDARTLLAHSAALGPRFRRCNPIAQALKPSPPRKRGPRASGRKSWVPAYAALTRERRNKVLPGTDPNFLTPAFA